MKKVISILLIALTQIGVILPGFAGGLSLEDVLNGVSNSPRKQASSGNVMAEKAKLSQSTSEFLPQLSATEIYTRTDDPVGVFAAKLQQGKFSAADFAIPTLNSPNAVNQWTTKITVKQPIIHSAVDIYKNASARHMVEAVSNEDKFEEQRLKLQSSLLYYAAVALGEKKRVLEDGIGKLARLEQSYEQAAAPSSANESNYLVAKSIKSELEAQKVGVETQIENTKRILAGMLGISEAELSNLTTGLPSVSEARKQLELDKSSLKRPDVQAAAERAKAASLAHSQAKWAYGPNVDGFASYNRYTGDFSSSKGSYEAGFMVSLPIFSGTLYGKAKEAAAQRVIAHKNRVAAEDQAKAEFENSVARLTACARHHELNERATEQATKALQIGSLRYGEGTLPLLDYSQTIQNWTMMRLRLVDSKYSIAESIADNKFQMGEL